MLIKVVALVLIVASAFALAAFSGFDELQDMPARANGGIDLPLWIGAGGLFLGGLLLIGFATRR